MEVVMISVPADHRSLTVALGGGIRWRWARGNCHHGSSWLSYPSQERRDIAFL